MTNRKKYLLVMPWLLVFAVGCSEHPAPEPAVDDLDWQINLDQPIGQLEEVMGQAPQQQHYNYTSANLAFIYDAKLYILFHDLLRSAGPEETAELIDTQRVFLREREIRVDAVVGTYSGGTGGPLAGNLEFIRFTQQRIEELGGDAEDPSPSREPESEASDLWTGVVALNSYR